MTFRFVGQRPVEGLLHLSAVFLSDPAPGSNKILFICIMNSRILSFRTAFSSFGFGERGGVGMNGPIWQMG